MRWRNKIHLRKRGQQQHYVLKMPCEVYSRIVGYLRPVQNWNDAKKQEFADRVTYGVPGRGELADDTMGVPPVRVRGGVRSS